MSERDRMIIGKEHAADRLMASQKLQATSPYLGGAKPPSRQQVSAVLHALADHTLMERLFIVAPDLAPDRANLGLSFQQASGMGRFFQAMGDWIAWDAAPDQHPTERGDDHA